jgi:hypothetical protein
MAQWIEDRLVMDMEGMDLMAKIAHLSSLQEHTNLLLDQLQRRADPLTKEIQMLEAKLNLGMDPPSDLQSRITDFRKERDDILAQLAKVDNGLVLINAERAKLQTEINDPEPIKESGEIGSGRTLDRKFYMDLRTLLEQAEKIAPDVFRLMYPRVYETVGQYASPRTIASLLTFVVDDTRRHGLEKASTAFRLLMPALKPMADRKMPLFFLAGDFVEAVKRTDFDKDIDWTAMRLPYEEGVFVLPRGCWKSMNLEMRLSPAAARRAETALLRLLQRS